MQVLRLTLHDHLVGYLTGTRDGRNALHFADSFREDPRRPTFTLTTHPAFENAGRLMASPWVKRHRLHPVLSNLLPEGALRELMAQILKVHTDNEFQLLTALGQDLPGALLVTPMAPEEVPPHLLDAQGRAAVIETQVEQPANKFSLAGVQMKFSMKAEDGRYNMTRAGELGDWIIKTPSTRHPHVPLNEYSAMSLAKLAGIDIPEIQLVPKDSVQTLPSLKQPDEAYAFAIRRFDRDDGQRVHSEDFAQILVKYPREKYSAANYEQIARIAYAYSGNALVDVQQLARRLLVNILLANGDAHLKNWSLIYTDRVTPTLAPAYDIVMTRAYIEEEQRFALNLGGTKEWYAVTLDHFHTWARHAGLPWRAIEPHLQDTINKARRLWPEALAALPMQAEHKTLLETHWQNLMPDFRISI